MRKTTSNTQRQRKKREEQQRRLKSIFTLFIYNCTKTSAKLGAIYLPLCIRKNTTQNVFHQIKFLILGGQGRIHSIPVALLENPMQRESAQLKFCNSINCFMDTVLLHSSHCTTDFIYCIAITCVLCQAQRKGLNH